MLDKEILDGFRTESMQLLKELELLTDALEDTDDGFPASELEQFAQKIDRIMGAAQTLNQLEPSHQGLLRIGAISQLCKRLGYKAAELKLAALVPFFAAFWAETLEVLEELIENVEDETKSKALAESFASTVQNRLQWLGDRIQKMSPTGQSVGQTEIDALLQKLQG